MKISKLFHWLYASLMLLPFASVVSTTLYYSFNKNAVIPQVDKEVSKEVDFNQYSQTQESVFNPNISITLTDNVNVFNHKILLSFYLNENASNTSVNYGYWNTSYSFVNVSTNIISNTNAGLKQIIINNGNYSGFLRFSIYNSTSQAIDIKNIQYFDLTQMFGNGNEPSIADFNTWFTDDYYSPILSEHIVIPNYETIQVGDNSINHFWLPSFGAIGYNIQSYIGWVIGGIFGLNVVNGIGFVIVRLFTYWLIISICWLIFDVLMYVPNLVHKWLDKAAID